MTKDVQNPRPFCRAGIHLMTPDNVAVKPSTRQRYCIACRGDKKLRRRGMFVLGDVWTDVQLKAASLPLLTNQEERLEKDIKNLMDRLYSLQAHLIQVKEIREPKVKALLATSRWD